MIIRIVALLALCVLPFVVAPASAADLSPAQEQAVRDIIRQELQQHPELVLDAIRQLQARDHQADEEHHGDLIRQHHDALTGDEGDFVLGNPKADVTVVEFFDYRCPYCKAMVDRVQELVRKDGNVRLVLKEFPILGPNSTLASKAAVAAQPQGHYLAFHTAMLEYKGDLDEKTITTLAAKAGIDTGKMKARLDDAQVTGKLSRNLDLGRALEIDGTPAFIVGDNLIPGAVDLATLQQAIADARKKN